MKLHSHFGLLVLLLLLWSRGLMATPEAIDGTLDLRQQNFDNKNDSVPLVGQWQFSWMQFAPPTPDQSASSTDSNIRLPQRINVPGVWGGTIINDMVLPNNGYASYALQIHLPNRKRPLAIRVPDYYSAVTVWANGELLGGVGQPGRNISEEKAARGVVVLPLPAHITELKLLLHVSGFHHVDAGLKNTFVLGDYSILHQQNIGRQYMAAFTVGAASLLSVYFLMVFFGHRRDALYFYIALALFAFSLRVFGTSAYILNINPSFPMLWLYRIGYCGFMLPMGFYLLFLHELFPQEFNKRVCQSFLILGVGGSIFVILTPAEWFSYLRDPYTALYIPIVGFILVGIIRAITRGHQGALIVGITSIVLASMALNDSLIQLGIYNGILLERWLYLLVILSMAGVLVIKLNRNDLIEKSLTNELREINRELSDRVKARTEDLENKVDELSISNHVALQARVEAETANRKKDKFLALMAHEVRTPLAGIQGSLNLLQSEDLTSKGKQILINAKNSAESLLEIANDALDISRIEAGKFELRPRNFFILPWLQGLQGLMEAGIKNKDIQLKVIVEGAALNAQDNLSLYGDSQSLQQVLLNLIGNAIKFTNEGEITLRVTQLPIINENPKNHIRLKFSVSDTGVGIPPSNITTIFEDFTQLKTRALNNKTKGSGLGLKISQQLVVAMGSLIHVQSKEGEGSHFSFEVELPVTDQYNTPQTKVVSNSNIETKAEPLTILVVEDDRTNRDILCILLERAGHKVLIATSGTSAVDMAIDNVIDVILMDIRLPEIDGLEATRRIRKIKPALPIFAVTANIHHGDIQRYTADGINAVLAKPISPLALQRNLAQIHHFPSPPLIKETACINNTPEEDAIDKNLPLLEVNNLIALVDSLGIEITKNKLVQYQADRQTQLDLLHADWKNRNFDGVAALSHRLSGSCGYQGMLALAQHLKKVECLAKVSAHDDLAMLFEQLPALITVTNKQLALWMNEYNG